MKEIKIKETENNNKNKLTKETKHKLMITAASIAILAGLYGTGTTASSNYRNNREGMVQMLSEKFNLNQSEVKEVIKEYKKENQFQRQAEMKIRLEAKLLKAVEEGKINNRQKELILTKRKEMENKINQDLENWSQNREERREQMESYREEIREWAKKNEIDLNLVGIKKRQVN